MIEDCNAAKARIANKQLPDCGPCAAGGYFIDDQGDFRHAQCRPAICFRPGDATKSRIANRLPRLVRKSVSGILVTPNRNRVVKGERVADSVVHGGSRSMNKKKRSNKR